MNNDKIIKLDKITKHYCQADKEIKVLDEFNFEFETNKIIAVSGKSGVGKTTLLNIIGGLLKPDSGEVIFNGENIYSYSENELNLFRNRSVGFIFQFHYLMPQFTALENVLIPKKMYAIIDDEDKKEAQVLLERAGLGDRLEHYPSQLSGGEQQRVAIARALINKPVLILADEPTGDMDIETGEEICRLLWELRETYSSTLIIVTHDLNLTQKAEVRLKLG